MTLHSGADFAAHPTAPPPRKRRGDSNAYRAFLKTANPAADDEERADAVDAPPVAITDEDVRDAKHAWLVKRELEILTAEMRDAANGHSEPLHELQDTEAAWGALANATPSEEEVAPPPAARGRAADERGATDTPTPPRNQMALHRARAARSRGQSSPTTPSPKVDAGHAGSPLVGIGEEERPAASAVEESGSVESNVLANLLGEAAEEVASGAAEVSVESTEQARGEEPATAEVSVLGELPAPAEASTLSELLDEVAGEVQEREGVVDTGGRSAAVEVVEAVRDADADARRGYRPLEAGDAGAAEAVGQGPLVIGSMATVDDDDDSESSASEASLPETSLIGGEPTRSGRDYSGLSGAALLSAASRVGGVVVSGASVGVDSDSDAGEIEYG